MVSTSLIQYILNWTAESGCPYALDYLPPLPPYVCNHLLVGYSYVCLCFFPYFVFLIDRLHLVETVQQRFLPLCFLLTRSPKRILQKHHTSPVYLLAFTYSYLSLVSINYISSSFFSKFRSAYPFLLQEELEACIDMVNKVSIFHLCFSELTLGPKVCHLWPNSTSWLHSIMRFSSYLTY